jgi:hypothetical protein
VVQRPASYVCTHDTSAPGAPQHAAGRAWRSRASTVPAHAPPPWPPAPSAAQCAAPPTDQLRPPAHRRRRSSPQPPASPASALHPPQNARAPPPPPAADQIISNNTSLALFKCWNKGKRPCCSPALHALLTPRAQQARRPWAEPAGPQGSKAACRLQQSPNMHAPTWFLVDARATRPAGRSASLSCTAAASCYQPLPPPPRPVRSSSAPPRAPAAPSWGGGRGAPAAACPAHGGCWGGGGQPLGPAAPGLAGPRSPGRRQRPGGWLLTSLASAAGKDQSAAGSKKGGGAAGRKGEPGSAKRSAAAAAGADQKGPSKRRATDAGEEGCCWARWAAACAGCRAAGPLPAAVLLPTGTGTVAGLRAPQAPPTAAAPSCCC